MPLIEKVRVDEGITNGNAMMADEDDLVDTDEAFPQKEIKQPEVQVGKREIQDSILKLTHWPLEDLNVILKI